ncbi:MAG TPA: cob(I)yrinic acid a,c-diamide adenosyltransferase [Thermoguttaceae bacterium]|nr:cob(I)yrinic acid a,c-diamide adenosyltransferase [Thermoguttaceae bacterium]
MLPLSPRPGDAGQTQLGGDVRVWKDSPVLEVLGTLDELTAHLGLARSLGLPATMDRLAGRLQEELFQIGAELAVSAATPKPPSITAEHLLALEGQIAQWEAGLPPVQNFILPAGTPAACQLHVARAVCRRAERRLTSLVRQSPPGAVSPLVQAYLNRLAGLLFVLARAVNLQAGCKESTWGNPLPSASTM